MSKVLPTRNEIYHFFKRLRDLGTTVFMFCELKMGTTDFDEFGGESYLCDGIIHLDLEREKRSLNLVICVLKMRETDIKRIYFPLVYTKNGFRIIEE